MRPETLQELLEAARRALPERPDPPFEFEVAFANGYEQLFSGDVEGKATETDDLISHVLENGRVVLAAEAGAGKSSIFLRTIEQALDGGVAGLRVDLRRWSPEVHDAWKALRESDARRMALLLERLSDVPVAERRLRRIASDRGALIAVDGLNEVPPSATRELTWVLDAFAARAPWAGVLVADRLQRRPLRADLWELATVSRVNRPDAATGTGLDNALLLDIASDGSNGTYNEAEILRKHLIAAAALSGTELQALEKTSLELYRRYRKGQGRFFETRALATGVGDSVVKRLLDSGELQAEGERAYFRHHLFHDALAAGALVGDSETWTRDHFDALTFEANSFDAIALALELVDEPLAADAFVMAVYDWSLYAAAYAVSQGRRHGSIAVSASAELALLAVLAERRWDPVAPSVQKVEDALRVSPAKLADRLLEANDLDEVVALVRAEADDAAADSWLPLFAGEVPAEQLIESLGGGPIPGWIAANALRRQSLTPETRQAVLNALRSPEKTVRWRAAHTLGADESDEAVEGLLAVLDADDWHWARYGAVRALVEVAARDEQRRQQVLEQLRERLEDLATQELVFRELQSALELRDPPRGWATAVAPLIEELFARASTVPEQDHWRRVGRRITESVLVARADPAA
jgi:HEAT repeat protein